MNKWIGMGRLTKDPEVRTSGESIIARYTLAIDRRFSKDEQADFINIVCFGKSAEFAEKYFKKGMKVLVTGRIQTGSYEKDGQKIYTTDIVAEDQEFTESKNASNNSAPASKDEDFMDIPKSVADDMPF